MNKRKIILIHLSLFIALTIGLLLSSEVILNYFAAGIHNVNMWIDLMTFGTLGILFFTVVSCLIFLKKIKLIGVIIALINLFWIWFSLRLLYKYHFTKFYPTYYIPNWILMMNSIFSIIGIIIGVKVISKKISLKKALLSSAFLIIAGVITQLA
ncbi:hypothetical protein DIS18_02360 [Algibacter marinivivus]|uniref:Uncharacterized protein n=1 Tax=Algibacter marinivivus TaxID=2100723 RepID=A0A2U2X6J0_9FLAO|nr:hypothetical protein [Algibacter marinivivus]PWH83417.1 hypothetical protein DIS18_02360 [Algibacter marinivivus]